jgi:hypothetical protein
MEKQGRCFLNGGEGPTSEIVRRSVSHFKLSAKRPFGPAFNTFVSPNPKKLKCLTLSSVRFQKIGNHIYRRDGTNLIKVRALGPLDSRDGYRRFQLVPTR